MNHSAPSPEAVTTPADLLFRRDDPAPRLRIHRPESRTEAVIHAAVHARIRGPRSRSLVAVRGTPTRGHAWSIPAMSDRGALMVCTRTMWLSGGAR